MAVFNKSELYFSEESVILPIGYELNRLLDIEEPPLTKNALHTISERSQTTTCKLYERRIFISGCLGLVSHAMGALHEILEDLIKRQALFGDDDSETDSTQFAGISGGAAVAGYFMAHSYRLHNMYWWFTYGRVNELFETRPLGSLINDLGSTFYRECQRITEQRSLPFLERDQLVIMTSELCKCSRVGLGVIRTARENGLAHQATCHIPGYTAFPGPLPFVDGQVSNGLVREAMWDRLLLADRLNKKEPGPTQFIPTLLFTYGPPPSAVMSDRKMFVIDLSKWKFNHLTGRYNKVFALRDYIPTGGKEKANDLFRDGQNAMREHWVDVKILIDAWRNASRKVSLKK